MKDIIAKIVIPPDASIKEALKKIDGAGMKILFVCNENGLLIGSLTDGDIRRRLLKAGSLQEKITHCFNRNPFFVVKNRYNLRDLKKTMVEKMVEVMPVIDKDGKKLVDLLRWTDIFGEETILVKKVDIPVVIMAGGMGERLGPFTKILPKPLIPVGEKPIVEVITDRFSCVGVKHFYITLNYKGEMVKTYFSSIEKDYRIEYIWEKDFLGTAGSLKLLPLDLKDTVIISNCDIIVDLNYADLLKFHRENKNTMTVVGSIQHHSIPYGIIHFGKDGRIEEIKEKPEFDFTVNTGLYVLEKRALSFIPKHKHFDMTEFMQLLLNKKENVGVYPVSQKSYIDIGQWEEYKKHTEELM